MTLKLPDHIKAVSFDFANTLYPLQEADLEGTIVALHDFLERRLAHPIPYDAMRAVYLEVRAHQFASNRGSLRDNDFTERIRQVIASVQKGFGKHDGPPDEKLVADAEFAYAEGFVNAMRLPDGLVETIAEISKRFGGKVAVCSNFMRADCIRRPLERDGITPHLAGVVVSCELGFIKPHPIMFEAVTRILGVEPHEAVHVGDDWDADIVGAMRAGLSAIYTTQWRDEHDPFYGKEFTPLAEIGHIRELL